MLIKVAELAKSKTPKVTYYSPQGKCMVGGTFLFGSSGRTHAASFLQLMENSSHDVDVRFYEGPARGKAKIYERKMP